MGGIITKLGSLKAQLSEIIGIKTGLALNEEKMLSFLPGRDYLNGEDDEWIRIRSEEVEEIVVHLMHAVGNIDTPNRFAAFDLLRKYDTPDQQKIFSQIMKSWMQYLEDKAPSMKPGELLTPKPFIDKCKAKWGVEGAIMGCDYIMALSHMQHISPWGEYFGRGTFGYKDVKELKDLFKSESLDASYGKFIDQRFINYLSQNFNEIDKINWRKFEALIGEFFDRAGFYVELGPGRDDDGVDARIWPNQENSLDAPLIIVQCKRQKSKIDKMVVKSLWADITHEGAGSGLIATTSMLSPGSQKVCEARGYPISTADRETLKKWVEALREPWSGIV